MVSERGRRRKGPAYLAFLLGRLLFSGRRRSDKADQQSFRRTRGRRTVFAARRVEREKDNARIVHIALKVEDLEQATKFYEDVFGIYQTKTGYARPHLAAMTDGNIELALMVYDSEEEAEAKLSGTGPCIHHGHRGRGPRGDRQEDRGERGSVFSDREEGAEVSRARRQPRRDRRRRAATKKGARARSHASCIVALKVQDLERATKFYENVFGSALATGHSRQHVSRHMTDGETISPYGLRQRRCRRGAARWAGPRIHHWVSSPDKQVFADEIKKNGGTILSKPDEGALKFRARTARGRDRCQGRYEKMKTKHAETVAGMEGCHDESVDARCVALALVALRQRRPRSRAPTSRAKHYHHRELRGRRAV